MRRGALPFSLAFLTTTLASAQPQSPLTTQPTGGRGGITLNFPDNVPLKVLVDYTAARLGWNILYDDAQVAARITLRATTPITEAALPGLLETVLRSKGLSLVDAGNGFKKIVSLAGAAVNGAAVNGAAGQPAAGAGILTQIFRLSAAEPDRVDAVVKPLLTTPGGTSTPVPDGRLLIVTDTADTVARIAQLIHRIDVPGREVTISFIPIKHADAAALTRQVSTLLTAKVRAGKVRGGEATEGLAQADSSIDVSYDPRTNQLLLVIAEDLRATASAIVAELDVPVTESQSPVRFYKLANATAVDVLATIQSLGGGSPPADGRASQSGASSTFNNAGTNTLSQNRPPAPTPLSPAPEGAPAGTGAAPAMPGSATPRSSPAQLLAQTPPAVREAIRGRPAQVTADPNTNTIIVIADPGVQTLYEQLIRAMDKRRPQVLIEATIVTIDTTDNFSLGVELGRGTGGSENNAITFSSFGLSTPDPTTGQLALAPGAGFNGTLINSKVASVVVRALAQSTRARVQAAPRILVNDNASGTLQSVAEQPFTSVNAGDTVSTTSFAGYAEAGTQITVTPHISEADYLQLDYDVTLSSFTSPQTTNGIPPARQRDAVQSRVTIPDGNTIIVGGLNRTNFLKTKDSVPFLGDIPILEYLFSNRSTSTRETTLFVFIRPVILRDDQFEDLKFLSERDAQKAEIKSDYPTSDPLTIDSATPSPGGPPPELVTSPPPPPAP